MRIISRSTSWSSPDVLGETGDFASPIVSPRSPPVLQQRESDIGHIESCLEAGTGPDRGAIPGADARCLLENVMRVLDAHNGDAMSEMSRESQDIALGIAGIAENGGDGGNPRLQPGAQTHAVIQQAAAFVQGRQQAQGAVPLTARERGIAVMDFVARVLANDFEEDSWRWAANAVNAGVRTGLIVGMTTTLRQLIGFSIEKALQLGDAPMPAREAIGIAAMLIGPGLNIAGFCRDELRDTATAQSRAARISMLALSIGALIMTSQTGNPSTLGASMSSFGPQVLAYTIARDLVQAFFPLDNNAPNNLGGSIAGSAVYSGVQFCVGEAVNAWAPSSGAGRVMAAADAAARSYTSAATGMDRVVDWFAAQLDSSSANAPDEESIRSRVHRALNDLCPDLTQDIVCGVLNATAEIIDDLVRPGISRALHVRQLRENVSLEAQAEGRSPKAAVAALSRQETEGLRLSVGPRWPDRTQVADQMLTTGAARTSAFQVIMGVTMSAANALTHTHLSPPVQERMVNAVAAATVFLIYQPFVYVHAQRIPATAALGAAGADVMGSGHAEEGGLRRRRIGTPTQPASGPTRPDSLRAGDIAANPDAP